MARRIVGHYRWVWVDRVRGVVEGLKKCFDEEGGRSSDEPCNTSRVGNTFRANAPTTHVQLAVRTRNKCTDRLEAETP